MNSFMCNLEVKSIKVFLHNWMDVVKIEIAAPKTFPRMKDENQKTIFTVEVQSGYGKIYCEELFGVKPEVIDMLHKG